jgi:hypothetical protein
VLVLTAIGSLTYDTRASTTRKIVDVNSTLIIGTNENIPARLTASTGITAVDSGCESSENVIVVGTESHRVSLVIYYVVDGLLVSE